MFGKMKKGICVVLVCVMLLMLVPGAALATPEMDRYSTSTDIEMSTPEEVHFTEDFLASASEHQFEGYSIDDIRRAFNDGGQIYQNFRV